MLKCEKSEYRLGTSEIEEYMKRRDIPDWFRGISKFQCNAANDLLEALLYDGEQQTTHRVKGCLTLLGLRPKISREQVRELMRISRGSDLAFLWFLLESHYKSKGPGYSINEQIIYSCIAHLDMVTTLRELDRLLPRNPEQEQNVPKKRGKRIGPQVEKFKQFAMGQNIPSPYLEIMKARSSGQQRPTPLKRPDPKIFMDDYEIYKDPNYIVRNEASRWFATYVTKHSKCIAGRVLREEIERILENMDEISKDMANKLVLCEHHKRLLRAEKKRKEDRKARARAEIRKYFDVDGARERRTTERILAQIERDVEMYRQKSRYDGEKVRPDQNKKHRKIIVLEGVDSIRYYEPDDDDDRRDAERDECKRGKNEVSTIYEGREELGEYNMSNNWTSEDGTRSKAPMPSFCDILRKSKYYNCFYRGFCESSAKPNKNPFDQGEQNFFMANMEHQPWHFDYQKIFHIPHSTPTTTEQRVKLSFVKALDCQTSLSPDINGQVDIESAFNAGFKKQWSRSVKEYNRKAIPEDQANKDEGDEVPIRFDRDYFDPNDMPYMIYMLKCCFERMKKDPKFVLASIPDAHKIPSLLYFIQDRYGKRYTSEERQRAFAETVRVLRAMAKLTKKAPLPRGKDFSTSTRFSYACRDHLLAKGAKVRQQYYEDLDEIIMNEARIFWFSMRPYLLASGPPTNTYFAYMPPRTVDLTRFLQWMPTEFRDMKRARKEAHQGRLKRF